MTLITDLILKHPILIYLLLGALFEIYFFIRHYNGILEWGTYTDWVIEFFLFVLNVLLFPIVLIQYLSIKIYWKKKRTKSWIKACDLQLDEKQIKGRNP